LNESPIQALKIVGHTGWLSRMKCDPSGSWLVSGGASDGTLLCWNLNQSLTQCVKLEGHKIYPVKIIFSPDNQRLISRDVYGFVYCWDLNVCEIKGKMLKGESGVVTAEKSKNMFLKGQILFFLDGYTLEYYDFSSLNPKWKDFFYFKCKPSSKQRQKMTDLKFNISSRNNLEIYDKEKLIQTLYFIQPISHHNTSENSKTLLVACDKVFLLLEMEK